MPIGAANAKAPSSEPAQSTSPEPGSAGPRGPGQASMGIAVTTYLRGPPASRLSKG